MRPTDVPSASLFWMVASAATTTVLNGLLGLNPQDAVGPCGKLLCLPYFPQCRHRVTVSPMLCHLCTAGPVIGGIPPLPTKPTIDTVPVAGRIRLSRGELPRGFLRRYFNLCAFPPAFLAMRFLLASGSIVGIFDCLEPPRLLFRHRPTLSADLPISFTNGLPRAGGSWILSAYWLSMCFSAPGGKTILLASVMARSQRVSAQHQSKSGLITPFIGSRSQFQALPRISQHHAQRLWGSSHKSGFS